MGYDEIPEGYEQEFKKRLVGEINTLQNDSEQRNYLSDFYEGYQTALKHLADRWGFKATVRYRA